MDAIGLQDLSITAGLAATPVGSRNNGRKYLFLQNTHATATVWVRFATDGAATATAAVAGAVSNIKLSPGASLSYENQFIPSAAMSVISDTATTPVVILTG